MTTSAVIEQRFCECGCGKPIVGRYNSNTGQRARFAKGHWIRVAENQRKVGGTAGDNRRATWPSRERIEALIAPPGNLTSAARTLHVANATLRRMIAELGVEYEPHANSLEPNHVSFGWAAEEHAAMILGATLHRTRGARGHAPFDLIWRDQRVEVKAARPTYAGRPPTLGWSFQIGHNSGKHDLLFCIACAPDGMPVRYLMIPPEAEPATTIRVGASLRGKWTKYLWQPG